MNDKDSKLLSEAYSQVEEGRFDSARWAGAQTPKVYDKVKKPSADYNISVLLIDTDSGNTLEQLEIPISGAEAAWYKYKQVRDILKNEEEV